MLQIKDYQKNDEKMILNLFKKSFNQDLNYEEWKWNYNDNIYSDKYIKLMWDLDTLAGHYSILPTQMKIYNKFYKTGLSLATMTSPEYKNQGIFVKLAKALYEENYNKLTIIYGFPNNNSLHGFIKYLGWHHISDIPIYSCYTYQLNSSYIDKNIKQVSNLDERVDILFKDFSQNYPVIIHRNKQYIDWRYKSNPKNKYYYIVYEDGNNYLGYCIYKLFKSENNYFCDLVDIMAKTNHIYTKLLLYLINLMNSKSIKYINSWFTNKDQLDIAKNLGFKSTNIITHFGFKINCDFINLKDINFEKWYLTMGDSDVF
ncbi:hypothetical protein UT300005_34190 [Clostridium sp. CTA-5]